MHAQEKLYKFVLLHLRRQLNVNNDPYNRVN